MCRFGRRTSSSEAIGLYRRLMSSTRYVPRECTWSCGRFATPCSRRAGPGRCRMLAEKDTQDLTTTRIDAMDALRGRRHSRALCPTPSGENFKTGRTHAMPRAILVRTAGVSLSTHASLARGRDPCPFPWPWILQRDQTRWKAPCCRSGCVPESPCQAPSTRCVNQPGTTYGSGRRGKRLWMTQRPGIGHRYRPGPSSWEGWSGLSYRAFLLSHNRTLFVGHTFRVVASLPSPLASRNTDHCYLLSRNFPVQFPRTTATTVYVQYVSPFQRTGWCGC
ncbi:hypothetical protein C8Q80DRAFT_132677 [Daedaleopsis nitida]|nr:hypothetical protein C8Q80DRAFT_132677 [Daedaleopsis nitida]